MNTVAFLIRHGAYQETYDAQGQKLGPFPDTPLSPEGEEQIRQLATRIQTLDVLYVSPFRRTRDSANILAHELGVTHVIIDEGLKDAWTPGWWGTPIEEVKKIHGDVFSHPKTADQESLSHLAERVFQTFTHIFKSNQGKIVGLVYHGDPIRITLERLLNPLGTLPDIQTLTSSDYLTYGEAWKLVLTPEFDVKERELVGRSLEAFGKGERIY